MVDAIMVAVGLEGAYQQSLKHYQGITPNRTEWYSMARSAVASQGDKRRDGEWPTLRPFIKRMFNLALVAGLMIGCSPGPQAQGQVPLSTFDKREWQVVPMSNGPSVYTACIHGNRVYLLDSYLHRESEYHLTSPKTITAVKGGC